MSTFLRPLAILSMAVLLFAAGCGGGDDSSESTATTKAPTTTAEVLADVTAEVTPSYTTFFHNFSGDLSLLQDGATFPKESVDAMRATAAKTGSIDVNVKQVTALSSADCAKAAVASPCAKVTFDLVVNGQPVVPNQTGYAVKQDGKWKVAKTTFCTLAALGGSPPQGC
jgi:hypothetical protein